MSPSPDDPVAPEPGPADPVAAARRLAGELLRPAAEHTDRYGVPAGHLDALARAGMLGMTLDAPPAAVREAIELLAGACLSTWFVAAQHATPLRMLAALPEGHPARARWLEELRAGRVLAGVAFSHLRARPRRPVAATLLADGSARFDGHAPWYTGWGLSRLALVAGLTERDEAVFALTGARDGRGLRAAGPLALAALGGTATVALEFDGLVVPAPSVVAVLPFDRWAAGDREMTANASPAVFGVARQALADLAAAGHPGPAEALSAQLSAARERAYRLLDEVAPNRRLGERTRLRARALEIATRASTALVVAGGGRAMSLDQRAQRLARETLFLTVQAQTPPVREETLRLLARSAPVTRRGRE